MSEKHIISLVDRPRPPPLPPRAPTQQLTPVPPLTSGNAPTQQTPAASDGDTTAQSSPASSDAPPSYDSIFTRAANDVRPSLGANDPRTSSTQSLKPVRSSEHSDKRRLLLIYIHGFMGDETSFQSFPAHVHHLAAALLVDSHTVHTKIYPRYRSKKNIEFARDDFSRWLAPHEASSTDVILLGHSMGGLVSAEVALAQDEPANLLRHHLLGTINFDVPFLGMHPSVIKSGLASIFSPAADPAVPQRQSTSTDSLPLESGNASTADHASKPPALPPRRIDTLFNPQQLDPNYNPAFDNDVKLPVRKGWRSAWHFINKHNEDLINATKQLVKSHMEFGGAMADYSGLKQRYCRIRALEEPSIDIRTSVMGPGSYPPRVRFVNYYTSSTGRPKKPKSPVPTPGPSTPTGIGEMTNSNRELSQREQVSAENSHVVTGEQGERQEESEEHVEPKSPIVLVEHVDEDEQPSEYDLEESNDAIVESMDQLEPLPMSDYASDTSDAESWADAVEDVELADTNTPAPPDTDLTPSVEERTPILTPTSSLPSESLMSPTATLSLANASTISLATTTSTLPPIPDPPPKPAEPDFSVYIDKETRKLAEKDYGRTLKTWERAVRDHDRAVRDREKLEEKRQRQAIKDGKRAEREEEKEAKRKEKMREQDAKTKEKLQLDSTERVFEIQRRETEKEWKEALNMKWNEEDGTVTPIASSSHAAPSLALSTTASSIEPSLSSVHAAAAEREKADKPRKERNFCTLPPKDSAGNRDPAWVKVFMPDVDEVGAHCGLFFETSPAYEQLVGDVGEKISEWVREAESERLAAELEDGPD